jgi:tRNA modification GTPase
MGLDELRRALAAELEELGGDAVVASTALRCRDSLAQAAAALERARELAAAGGGEELVAAEVRAALDGLGQVVGAVYTEDVLDRVFSRFCIGK